MQTDLYPGLGNSRRMVKKGASFYLQLSPAAPSLPYSHTDLSNVTGAYLRRARMIVNNVDNSFSTTPDDLANLLQNSSLADLGSPIPRSLLEISLASPASHTLPETAANRQPDSLPNYLRPLQPGSKDKAHRFYDSGLGSSIASSSVADFKTETMFASVSAVSMSATASSTVGMDQVRGLSNRAVNRIYEHTLNPLRTNPSFKVFEPILFSFPRRIRIKEITCLRDVEKTLLFMAPERAKDKPSLCLDFCRASVRCVQATVIFLNDREQTRPGDRPYSNGYFLDLEEQLKQYAFQLSDMAGKGSCSLEGDGRSEPSADLDALDEIKLFGGVAKNGRPVELVRVKKDGRAFSLATGEQVEYELDHDEASSVRMKRSLSEEAEDDEAILRSMARRKKGALAEVPVMKHCSHCNKTFARQCDKSKHEKSHRRPHKCPHPSCKYHENGWPTEKELGRHLNDKHSVNPEMFECRFSPCPYKSKRESNCKQHMEKAHGWTYQRSKNAAGAHVSKMVPSPHDTANPDGSASASASPYDSASIHDSHSVVDMLTPISNERWSELTPPPEHSLHSFLSPVAASPYDYPSYLSDHDFHDGLGNANANANFSLPVDEFELDIATVMNLQRIDDIVPYGSTFHDTEGFIVRDDIYAAAAHMPTPALILPSHPFVNQGLLAPATYLSQPMSTLPVPVAPHLLAVKYGLGQQFGEAPFPTLSPLTPGSENDARPYTPPAVGELNDGFDEVCLWHWRDRLGDSTGSELKHHDFVLFPPGLEPPASDFMLFDALPPSAGLGILSPHSFDDLRPLQPSEGAADMDWSPSGSSFAYSRHSDYQL